MRKFQTLLAACLLATAAYAQQSPSLPILTFGLDLPYQVGYAANLSAGDSQITITNDGFALGNLCVNVYTYDEQEELIACCACPVTPNGINSLSVNGDLVSNTLTPGVPTAAYVKLLATSGGACNAAVPGVPTWGMVAWGTTLAPVPSGGFAPTRTAFVPGTLSELQLGQMAGLCGFIQADGTGYGICKSCAAGALAGGSKK